MIQANIECTGMIYSSQAWEDHSLKEHPIEHFNFSAGHLQ
jgi:hypothetical protein